MTVRLSLLAILDAGACYGYQLRSEFVRRTGSIWPLNVGQVYNTLDRLERDGFVVRLPIDSEGQIFYRISDVGHAAVCEWFGSSVTELAPARTELALKLALAATLPGVDVAAVIAVQSSAVQRHIAQLSAVEKARPQTVEKLAEQILVDLQLVEAQAELQWLGRTAKRMREAADDDLGSLSLRQTPPKRGRPAQDAH